MIKISLLFVLMFSVVAEASERPAGFLWYNVPKIVKKADQKAPQGKPFSQLSFQQKDAVLAYYTREAWHQSMQDMSVPAMHRYLSYQQYWLERATDTTRLFEKTLLQYPEHRYDITHPSSQMALQLRDEERALKEEQIVRAISKTHGLLYFYRGSNALDKKQNGIVANFAAYYGLSLIAVSVDEVMDPTLPQSKKDEGQARALGVRFFPALFLVNPKSQKVQPVAYGINPQDQLLRQFRLVATNFAKGDL